MHFYTEQWSPDIETLNFTQFDLNLCWTSKLSKMLCWGIFMFKTDINPWAKIVHALKEEILYFPFWTRKSVRRCFSRRVHFFALPCTGLCRFCMFITLFCHNIQNIDTPRFKSHIYFLLTHTNINQNAQ